MDKAVFTNNVVLREATDEDAAIVGHDGKPLFDIRDVSSVKDIAPGWLANDDGTYSAPPAPPALIPSITRAQAKIQLRRAGLRDKAEALIAQADPEVQDWYAEAGVWMRDNANVIAIAKQMKIKDADLDNLFRAAALIEA